MPSEQLFNPGTVKVWKSSAGDFTLTFASTADQALAVGAIWDRGAGAQPGLFRWAALIKVNATVAVGRSARIYLAQSKDGVDIPGRLATTDSEIASATDRTRNLKAPIGSVNADSTSSSDKFIATGECFISARYVSPAIFNDFGVIFNASETDQYFELQPIPPQQQ